MLVKWAPLRLNCLTQWRPDEMDAIFSENFQIHSLKLNCYINGVVQDCSISIANALEILQSCTKPSIFLIQTLLQHVLKGPLGRMSPSVQVS